jgi:spore germination protein YaaH
MLSTWIPYWNDDAPLRRVRAHARLFEYASPFWFQATSATRIVRVGSSAGLAELARSLRVDGVRVVPTVTESWSAKAAARILNDPDRRAAHVRALVALVRSGGYGGLDLDYEQMAVTTRRVRADRVRAGFTALIERLCPRLRRLGRRCTVTVMARTDDAKRIWRRRLAVWVYDYGRIAAAADRMRIMVYAEHGPREAPGPIATTGWTREILDYALATAPPRKLELALPLFGYDWASDGATSVLWTEADARRRARGRPYGFARAYGAPYFQYRAGGVRHTVWYEDARSTALKVALARKAGVASIGFWYVGHEDPRTWPMLRRRLRP